MERLKVSLLLTCIFLSCVSLRAQQTVSVYATAIDRDKLSTDLQITQLDGEGINIKSVERVKPPQLSCVVVWDSSNSERYVYESLRFAASSVLRNVMSTPHRCTFVNFDSGVDSASGSSNDSNDLIKAINKFRPGGGTAAYDGVLAGVALLENQKLASPRVMYLFSDFEDNQSHHTLDEIRYALLSSQTRLYAFVPEQRDISSGTINLRHLTELTGGELTVVPTRDRAEKMDKALQPDLSLISAENNTWFRITFEDPRQSRLDKPSALKIAAHDKSIRLNVASAYISESK